MSNKQGGSPGSKGTAVSCMLPYPCKVPEIQFSNCQLVYLLHHRNQYSQLEYSARFFFKVLHCSPPGSSEIESIMEKDNYIRMVV